MNDSEPMKLDDMDIDLRGYNFEQETDKVAQPEESPVTRNSLDLYYKNFFPYKLFYKWLGNENSEYFERREFSFTLENDIYVRFQCYKNEEEFRNGIVTHHPMKIDIGAVFNTLPKLHNQTSDSRAFVPVQKEMIFDIDMTDYDDIRTCCKEAKICDKCWKFMIVAYRILNSILTEDFGFEHIMWVFSGRRGIHCWISDDRARVLNNEGRSAIANYIKFKMANQKTGITTSLREPLHPSIERSLCIIEECFDEYILQGQELLQDVKANSFLIGLIKAYFNFKKDVDIFISTKISPILDHPKIDSSRKFNLVKDEMVAYEGKYKLKPGYEYTVSEMCLKEFKLNVLYPRLDINVSKHINHLLKSPFCIHPKTGMVSVPLNEKDIINFKIENIPKLNEIVEDFNAGKTNIKFKHFMENFTEFTNSSLK